MIYTIRDRVKAGIDDGLSLERIQSAKPTAEFDARRGNGKIKASELVAVIYNELSK